MKFTELITENSKGQQWAKNFLSKLDNYFVGIRKKIVTDENGVYIDVSNATSRTGDFKQGTEILQKLQKYAGQTWVIKDFKIKYSEMRPQGYTASVRFVAELTPEAEKYFLKS